MTPNKIKQITKISNNTRKTIIPVISRFTTKKSIYHRIFELLNTNLAPTRTERKYKQYNNLEFNNETTNTNTYNLSGHTPLPPKRYPVKGLRRSIRTDKSPLAGVKSDHVVLKIMDQKGNPRIEIKLISVNRPDKMNSKNNELTSKTQFNMYVQENDSVSIKGDLPNNSIIQLLPNNTLTVNNNTYIITDANESLSVFDEFDESYTEKQGVIFNSFIKDSNESNISERYSIPTDESLTTETVNLLQALHSDINKSNDYTDTTISNSENGYELVPTFQPNRINVTLVYSTDTSNILLTNDKEQSYTDEIEESHIDTSEELHTDPISAYSNTYEDITNVIQTEEDHFIESTSSISGTFTLEEINVSFNTTTTEKSEIINQYGNSSSTVDSHTVLLNDVVSIDDASIEITTINSEGKESENPLLVI